MKRLFLLIATMLILVVSPVVNVRADSTPLTDEQITAIKVGCNDGLRGISQIQKSEAGTRVNRGREYETLLRLVAALNSRIVLNKLDAPALTSTAARLQMTFTQFQSHYIDYADKMDATLAINCNDTPVTFYDSLNNARVARNLVASDVKQMDILLDEYQKGLDSLKATITKLDGSEVNQP